MSSKIVEQVRSGLEEKIEGLQIALRFVHDPRELDRLQKELKNANAALDKINQPDTRTAEEVEKVAKMISDDESDVKQVSWSSMSPLEKFKYQMELYSDKLDESLEAAQRQLKEIQEVVDLLEGLVEDNPCIVPLYNQFTQTLLDIQYSIGSIENQRELKPCAFAAVDAIFSDLECINKFLNNPMSLPHLSEKRESELGALRNGNIKAH